MGADDYITKPFSIRELKARVKALVRRARELDPRTERQGTSPRILVGSLTIDTEKHRVFVDETEVELTAKE